MVRNNSTANKKEDPPYHTIRDMEALCVSVSQAGCRLNQTIFLMFRYNYPSWNCKYHIVFAPKYRIKIFYHEKREAVGKILRQLCEWTRVKIVRAEVCPDHVHIAVYSLVIRQPE